MMVYLISYPDQVKNKIFASLAPSWFILSFFTAKTWASRTFVQNVHRVNIGSQRSEIVGQKSGRLVFSNFLVKAIGYLIACHINVIIHLQP
jgi:hypothetical protein